MTKCADTNAVIAHGRRRLGECHSVNAVVLIAILVLGALIGCSFAPSKPSSFAVTGGAHAIFMGKMVRDIRSGKNQACLKMTAKMSLVKGGDILSSGQEICTSEFHRDLLEIKQNEHRGGSSVAFVRSIEGQSITYLNALFHEGELTSLARGTQVMPLRP